MLNLFLIIFLVFMAYWWSMQGLFSALIHFALTILAGVIALAVWEPLATGLLLGFLGDGGWGAALLLPFALALLGLRVLFDTLVPGNLHFPAMVDKIGGGGLGFLSGVLTAGMLILGLQMIGGGTLLGYRGWKLDDTGRPERAESLLVPADSIAAGFFSFVSNGSFHAMMGTGSMVRFHPDWAAEVSFYAQSEISSQSRPHRHALTPGLLTVPENGLYSLAKPPEKLIDRLNAELRTVVVETRVNLHGGASDTDGAFRVVRHQVVLGHEAQELGAVPGLTYPLGYIQGGEFVSFDKPGEYARSTTGVETAMIYWVFQIPIRDIPQFIQVKQLRMELPVASTNPIDVEVLLTYDSATGTSTAVIPTANPEVEGVVISANLPANFNKNQFPGTVQLEELGAETVIVSGKASLRSEKGLKNSKLAVRRVLEPQSTRIVQVSLGKLTQPDSLVNRIRERASVEAAAPHMIDKDGRRYFPMGYVINQGGGIKFDLNPADPIKDVNGLDLGALSGDVEMVLYYQVGRGIQLTRLKHGEEDLRDLKYLTIPIK